MSPPWQGRLPGVGTSRSLSRQTAHVMVRPRRPVDLPRCIEVLGEVHRLDRYPMQWPADPAAWLQPPGLAAAWVAEQDGQVVGHIALVNSGDGMPPNGVAAAALPIAEISRLFVAPQARGGGLARALLDAVTAQTGHEGRRLVLEVVDDAAAVAFYERLGWRQVTTRPANWTTSQGRRPLVRRYAAPQPPREPSGVPGPDSG